MTTAMVDSSILDSLRTFRGELGEKSKPLDVDVPEYHGLLVLRAKWIPYTQLTEGTASLDKIEGVGEKQLAAAADVLIVTCKEILVRVDDSLVPAASSFGDPALAEALGFEDANTVRENVKQVIPNDYALLQLANEVIEWLQDTTKRVNKDYLGN